MIATPTNAKLFLKCRNVFVLYMYNHAPSTPIPIESNRKIVVHRNPKSHGRSSAVRDTYNLSEVITTTNDIVEYRKNLYFDLDFGAITNHIGKSR